MKPFLSGKRTHETAPLRALHIHRSAPPLRQPNPTEGPTVEVVKEGDKVVRILVTCACGEKIEVDCLYPAGS